MDKSGSVWGDKKRAEDCEVWCLKKWIFSINETGCLQAALPWCCPAISVKAVKGLCLLCLNWGNISIIVLSFQVWWRLHGDNPSERRATRHRASAAVHGWNIRQLTAAWTSSECAALPAASYWRDTGTDLQPHGTGSGTVQRWRLCCQPDDSWSGSTCYRNGRVELLSKRIMIISRWEAVTGVWLKMSGIWHINCVQPKIINEFRCKLGVKFC